MVLFSCLMILLSGCATTPAERGLDAPSVQGDPYADEKAVGAEINREILSQFYPYTDPKVVQYVNDLGDDLAEHARRKDFEYRFTILYDQKIYATSAPGGYIYVTTGMLDFLQNEAELAAVLSHEIARQQYKDPRFTTQNQEILNTAAQVGAQVAPMFGPFGSLAALGIVLLHAYSQGAHKTPDEMLVESDRNAMEYLLDSGYDPQALMDVLERFLKAGPQTLPLFYDYYQSRPITEERMKAIKKNFAKLSLGEIRLRTDAMEYQDVMKGVREIYKAGTP